MNEKIEKIKVMSKKKLVIEEIFKICCRQKQFIFHNNLVKEVCKAVGFGNPFDATKFDNRNKLPPILIENDYALIHLGEGNHMFVKGINKVYHDFEPIQKTLEWDYHKSILNLYNSSESNILSIANNQRILHHFLFGEDREFDDLEVNNRPKTYFPHRTKTNLKYSFGNDIKLELKNVQIEVDLTIEFKGTVGVFEAKNGKPSNFSIYQIYHPFLYYFIANKRSDVKGKIKDIYGVYLVRVHSKKDVILKIWAYTFTDPLDITSISLIRSSAYKLMNINPEQR